MNLDDRMFLSQDIFKEVQMTEVETRKYVTVTFLSLGSFFLKESKREVDTNDPGAVAKLAPKDAFCFVLQDWVTKTTIVNGKRLKRTKCDGDESGRFYLEGTVYTLAQLKEKFGDDPNKRILISNMDGNGWDKAIQCRTGNWQPFTERDVLLHITV